MRGTKLETKKSRSLEACEVSPGFMSPDIGSKRGRRWGKMLKSFSKKVLQAWSGKFFGIRSRDRYGATDQPSFSGVKMK